MFDLSWGEIMIIGIIGTLVVGPKELPHVIHNIKEAGAKIRELWSDMTSNVKDVTDDITKEVDIPIKQIVDLDGNLQDVYDLSDFMPTLDTTGTENIDISSDNPKSP